MTDKEKLLKAILSLLQMTEAGKHMTDIRTDPKDEDMVIVDFDNEEVIRVNIARDSKFFICKDIFETVTRYEWGQ